MPEVLTWECYGHGASGTAIVLAVDRAAALRMCREWLGWGIAVAFRAPERQTLFENSGGTAAFPVVFGADNEHYSALTQPLTVELTQGREDARTPWEDRYG